MKQNSYPNSPIRQQAGGGSFVARSQRGLTLIEILAAFAVVGLAVSAFVRTSKPAIAVNKSNKATVDITGGLAEILDSVMVQPVTVLDGMSGQSFNSRQGTTIRLMVSSYSQADADAILMGIDVSWLRTLTVTAVSDTSRHLSTTVSNYQGSSIGRCFL